MLRADQQSRAERDKRQRQLAELRRRLKQHPCHSCKDREAHSRWGERWWKLKRQTDDLNRQIKSRTGAVAKVFDRVTEVLLNLGYLVRDAKGTVVSSPHGRILRRIYGERDLLVAECLRRGTWSQLDAPALAALTAALVYEPRREGSEPGERGMPRGPFRAALEATEAITAELGDREAEHRLPGSEPLSAVISLATQRWASGASLDSVLRDADLAAGDFVRWIKQAVDLLDQISLVADGELGRTARKSIDAIRRGIVAYSSVA
jgi:ATP-dependent RNA helicase HelY